MTTRQKIFTTILILSVVGLIIVNGIIRINNNITEVAVEEKNIEENAEENQGVKEEEQIPEDPIVFEGMTEGQLAEKLNRSLGSNLSGTGNIFARKSIELGIDPYLSVAIVLLETGCAWNCSSLVVYCNNVGGMKGYGCGDSSYAAFNTLEEGIGSYMNNLANNYIYQGLNTPELMERKYSGSNGTWAQKVNNYIYQIRSR